MIVLITGTTSGIGKSLVSSYLKRHHHVILISRPGLATDRQLERLAESTAVGSFRHFACDLSEQSQIIQTCEALKQEYNHIDVLINNAAVYPAVRLENSQGIELTFAVNVLAPFLLITHLFPLLKSDGGGQILNICSIGERYAKLDWNDIMAVNHYDSNLVYNNSKKYLAMMSYFFSERYKNEKVFVNALHPGATNTSLIKPDAVSSMSFWLRLVYKIAKRFNRSPNSAAAEIRLFIRKNRATKWTGCFIKKGLKVKPSHGVDNKRNQDF